MEDINNVHFQVMPLYAVTTNEYLGSWVLRDFQKSVMDKLSSKKDVLLVAPTGSGKTLTLLLAEEGAVGVYPNNELLLDQQRSIDKILRRALKGRLINTVQYSGVDVLRVYEINPDTRDGPPVASRKQVAIVLLSGRYIGYVYDEKGRLVPKHERILTDITSKICESIGVDTYLVTLATPDTAQLIMAGAYRDFELVGYTVHNALLSAFEGYSIERVLSETRVATARGSIKRIAEIRNCLLEYPWFIDEYHLYGVYEAAGLASILKVYRDYYGMEEPVILSSATPSGTLYDRLSNILKLASVKAGVRSKGPGDTLIRGETSVEVVYVPITGRGKWFRVGDYLPGVVEDKVNDVKKIVDSGAHVFIIVDRINQVPPIITVLADYGFQVECGVSMPPPGCSNREELVLVGSESVTQGIDRENVRYGIITAFNWAKLIQRFGRIGRRVDSEVVIVAPGVGEDGPLSSLNGRRVDYDTFASTVQTDYPNIEFTLPKTRQVMEVLSVREKLLEVSSTIAFAQVSKPKGTLEALAEYIRASGENILNRFLGPPEAIPKIMLFRSSGFEVLVKTQDGEPYLADIASVLRNYIVKRVGRTLYKGRDGIVRRIVEVEIDYTPGRQVMVLEPSLDVREDLADKLTGIITTLGVLFDLGYRLYIRGLNDKWGGLEVPATPSVSEQVVAIVKTSEEVASYLTYIVSAVQVRRGEAMTHVALLL